MSRKATQSRFEAVAKEYEDTRRKFIPDFDTFYQSGVDFLRCGKSVPRVLDLGAGTGLYSLKLLERYPSAEVTLIDFADGMLKAACRNFEGNNHVKFILGDYGNHDFADERFDIVISALSIHHFDDDDKKMVYEKIFNLLDPGGEFLNADQIAGDSECLDLRYRELHAEFVRKNATETEYRQFVKNIEIDLRSPVFSQLDWLKTAGFSQTDCVYKLNCFALMYARKD